MRRVYIDYIQDILSSLYKITDFTKGVDFTMFVKDEKTINAVIWNLIVIGETINRLPDETKTKYPEIPWKDIVGMRNRLIHRYDDIDLEIVWTVVQKKIPPLIPAFKKILSEIEIGEAL